MLSDGNQTDGNSLEQFLTSYQNSRLPLNNQNLALTSILTYYQFKNPIGLKLEVTHLIVNTNTGLQHHTWNRPLNKIAPLLWWLSPCKTHSVHNCIRHIFRGFFIFANFASLVLFANLSTRENIYLRSRRMNATCVRNTLLSSIANLTTHENVLNSRFAKN